MSGHLDVPYGVFKYKHGHIWKEFCIPQFKEVVHILTCRDPDLAERPNRSGWTPLMYACYYCHHDIIEYLVVTAGVDVNQGNPRCETPLILATKCGHVKAVSFLLQVASQLAV